MRHLQETMESGNTYDVLLQYLLPLHELKSSLGYMLDNSRPGFDSSNILKTCTAVVLGNYQVKPETHHALEHLSMCGASGVNHYGRLFHLLAFIPR